jgi:hypothetical protein
MFDELIIRELIGWAIAALIVAALIGTLRRSRLRSILIWVWALAPILVVGPAVAVGSGWDSSGSLPFMLIIGLVVGVPWNVLVLLSYNLARRFREVRAGLYGDTC